MKTYKEKCQECGKIIEGVSDREVKAWMRQHIIFMHNEEIKKAEKDA